MVDKNIILFWKKALNCDNNIIRTLAVINKWKLGLFLSKYRIPSINVALSDIKMSYMETLRRHGTQQWKNTVLLELVHVHFQYYFYVLIFSDCVVVYSLLLRLYVLMFHCCFGVIINQ